MGVVVRRYIDILTIIINCPYSTCISSFFSSSIPTSLFILKMFFRSCIIYMGSTKFTRFETVTSSWVTSLADRPVAIARAALYLECKSALNLHY